MLRTTSVAVTLQFLATGRSAEIIVFNDDGCWNWLQDERVIVAGGRLIIGSVAAGTHDPGRMGDVEAVAYDLKTGGKERFTLHHADTAAAQKLWRDDHNAPAFAVGPGGRVLALYAHHGRSEKLYHRELAPGRGVPAWAEERTFAVAAGSRVGFPNLLCLSAENDGHGRVLSFFRGLNNKAMPSWAYSDDAGKSWSAGNVFIEVSPKTVPYVKYAGNGRDTVHIAFTDGHRINFGNGVHHVFYRTGNLHRSDGTPVRSLREGLKAAGEGTRIYQANAESVAMISDLQLDAQGRPHVVYSVQKDTARLRPRPVGADHRYRYARWTGQEWFDREIAFAGGEVHPVADDDCTGLIALDPQNLNVVYISTDADPIRGTPLISAADGKRHWEIFKGATTDGGNTWGWAAITRDSSRDNIRPVVPVGLAGQTVVIWLRGVMRMPNDYEFEVVGLVSNTR
jgi:hypothetical protein